MDRPSEHAIFNVENLTAFLTKEFPQLGLGRNYSIEAAGPMSARLRLHYRPDHLRPGGTISGPTNFALADVAL
ncbi:MAG: phenylacetic acid degradation protein, partial [Roseiarcus sp.]